MIAPRVSVGERPHRITLQNPAPPVSDTEGDYTHAYADLAPPAVQASIVAATAADLERVGAGTVLSQATHVVTFPYHAGVNTETRVVFGARTFSVIGVSNLGERNVETVALCMEVVT